MSPAFDIYSGLKQLNQSTDINLSTAQYKKIEKYLAPYDLTLESKLSDAMFSGNHLTKDKVTGLQSNFYELYLKQVEIEYNSAKDKQLFLEDLITKKTNSYLYDVQEYNHEVLKPLKFWEHQAVAFNCIYNSYDPQLYDLLYYIVKSEPDLDVYIDSFSVGDALHRLSQGAADAFIARWAKHQIQTNALHESTKINIKQDSMLKIPITIPNQQLYYTLNTDSVKWEVITDLFNALKNNILAITQKRKTSNQFFIPKIVNMIRDSQ